MKTRTHALHSRLTALLGVLAMMATLVVVAATPAFAATSGSARLLAGAQVLPGDFTYTLRVDNTDVTTPAANLFVVTMPAGIGVSIAPNAVLEAPNGFTGRLQQVGPLQRVIYSGGSLASGANLQVSIPTTVAAPSTPSETSGRFDVQLSSDSGRSFSTASVPSGQTLTTVIRFLEINLVDTIAPTPAGARDGTGTEGQKIKVGATVKNYLPTPVAVDVDLSGAAGASGFPVNDSISGTVRIPSVPGNGTAQAAFDVTLGAAVNNQGNAANRPVNFNAKATEVTVGGTSLSTDNLPYTSQIRARLSVTGQSFAPRAVAPGPRTFSLTTAHTGTPAFTVTGASVSFADTVATIDGNSPRQFATGDSKTLTFTGQVKGDDGQFPVDFLYNVLDENGYDYLISFGRVTEPTGNPISPRRDVLVTIDALAPVLNLVISLPRDAEGAQQAQAKDGDTITVNGTIDDTSALLGDVVLVANGVRIAEATPTRSTLDRTQFTATFEDVTFPLAAGSFTALGSATDVAGNVGETIAETKLYDNVVPELISARTESTSDAPTAALDALVSNASRISVRFAENNKLLGGCNPSDWTVDGQQNVKDVLFTNGQSCRAATTAGPDNERILVLSTAYDREATPSVTYTPGSAQGKAKDGAGNFAIKNTVTAVTGIVPALPDLVEVYRNTGSTVTPDQCLEDDQPCELAYFDQGDTDAYWTRFAGDDTVVCVAGARAGYQVEVTDGNGNALVGTRKSATGSPSCIRVPVGSTDTLVQRGVRFINSAGVGPAVKFQVRLDRVKPTISTVTRVDDKVTVAFNDKLVEGEDFALDWLIYEKLSGNAGNVFYSPDSVTAPGEGETIDRTKRVLTVNFRNYGTFAGVGYDFQSGDFGGARYADRAGNLFANNPGPVPPSAQ